MSKVLNYNFQCDKLTTYTNFKDGITISGHTTFVVLFFGFYVYQDKYYPPVNTPSSLFVS